MAAAILVAVESVEAQKKLMNIDYLGFGYDAAIGNPHSDLRDPGFVEPVIQLLYDSKLTTADGEWLIPDGTTVQQITSCSYIAESTEINGTSAYRDSLSVDARVEGGAFDFKFSASTEYKHVRSGTSYEQKVYVNSEARCMTYKAKFRGTMGLMHFTVTSEFDDAVNHLPTNLHTGSIDSIDKYYLEFIRTFGTHFADTVDMGSKAIIRSEFERSGWSRLQQSGVKVTVAASASFQEFNFGRSLTTAQEKETAQAFESTRKSWKMFYTGSKPDSDFVKWAKDAGASPYPITYRLIPLTYLLVPRYFPNINPSVLEAKRNLLNASYTTYCHSLPGCGVPEPDQIPFSMGAKKEAFSTREHTVRCKNGYSLLSCGYDYLQTTRLDLYRSVHPSSTSSCLCRDLYGGFCVAWCTNAKIQGFELVRSSWTKMTNTINVACPPGKKVVGCHIYAYEYVRHDAFRSYYPTDDGNGCTCFDLYGNVCFATCASNIKSHSIESAFATFYSTARCPTGTVVLGCGIRTLRRSDSHWERWRRVQITPTNDACQCYDYLGATCYAICGTFG